VIYAVLQWKTSVMLTYVHVCESMSGLKWYYVCVCCVIEFLLEIFRVMFNINGPEQNSYFA